MKTASGDSIVFNLTSKGRIGGSQPLFVSPSPAGRRITAGFTYLQRIGKSASIDVWFPDYLKEKIDAILAAGDKPGPADFPAEWAAVRQFELLQEAGNLSIYDLEAEQLMRSMRDLTTHMHGGGYRVSVVSIGSYSKAGHGDELEILDRRLQSRISYLINMLYLEEQSEKLNAVLAQNLRLEKWDYRTALPHVGVTLGARDLFGNHSFAPRIFTVRDESHAVPGSPSRIDVAHASQWIEDLGVKDVQKQKFACVNSKPAVGQYTTANGVYQFSEADAGRKVLVSYRYETALPDAGKMEADRRHCRARHFFEILELLPQKHILHETAVGLQLPESINENQWIYIARDGEKFGDFARLMDNLFAPFNGMSLSELDGRADAASKVKAMVGHMRGYGDRLTPDSDNFYRNLARCVPH